MGVKGLWQLISSSGSPITLESLENKVLAIDVSIWLHQSVRGFKTFGSDSAANAHLFTLFNRICKLLFYRIRPIFVFDGGVPQLKKQTLSARRLKREAAAGKAQKVRERLLTNLLRSDAVRRALGKKGAGPNLHRVSKPVRKENDMFDLPPLDEPLLLENKKASTHQSDSESEEDYVFKNLQKKNVHDFEYNDSQFKALPLQRQHEILSELQVTRKENSWGTVNQMPEESDNFSSFQLNRLLKRKEFQDNLVGISSKIQKTHAAHVEAQLFGDLETYVSLTNRIVSEESSHSVLIKNLNDKKKESGETIKDMIKEQEELAKKPLNKKDFLCELTKQGIVKTINAEKLLPTNLDSEYSGSDSEDFTDDESHMSASTKAKLDEASFLKAVDYVLDESELNQEEILAIIKQSQNEVDAETNDKSAISVNKSSNVTDLNLPSTSKDAPGIMYNSNTESSSDDDEEFIDVPIEDDMDSSCTSIEHSIDDSIKNSYNNEKAILSAKSDCSYIKLSQKKLNSPKKIEKFTRDSRKLLKNDSEEWINEKDNSNNETGLVPRSISFSLSEIDKAEGLGDDDIFKDILNVKRKKESHNMNVKEIFEHNRNLDKDIFTEKLNEHSINVMDKKNNPNVEDRLDNLLKAKLEELVAAEIIKMSKTQCSPTKERTLNDTSSATFENDVSQINMRDSMKDNELISQNEVSVSKSYVLDEKSIKYKDDNKFDSIKMANVSMDDTDNEEEIENEKLNSAHAEKDEIEKRNLEVNKKTLIEPSNSQLNNSEKIIETNVETPVKYSENELKIMEKKLAEEQQTLISEAHNAERVAVDISNQVYGEAQGLLQLFGLPYIVAPMEAEAQCAFLDIIGLTNGSITDDSDIFLFGGKRVYKNFFNQSRHVECFTIDSINHNFGLDREKLITLALLTGSDYTIGIESVGAVLGMEILGEFPGKGFECLQNFKKWWGRNANSVSLERTFSKTKQRLSHLYLPDSFPNEYIYKAYMTPEVDESKEKFSWAVPNAERLKQFATEKFGWSHSKTNEMLIPIFKKLGLKENQMRIDSYFSSIKLIKDSPLCSKRLQEAIDRTKGTFVEPSKVKKSNLNNSINKKQSKKKKMELKDEASDEPSTHNLRYTKKNTSESKNETNKMANMNSFSTNEPHEQFLNSLSTNTNNKEEKKLSNFKKLLEKDKILQAEKEEQEKANKKAAAALVLAKSKQKNKKQRK